LGGEKWKRAKVIDKEQPCWGLNLPGGVKNIAKGLTTVLPKQQGLASPTSQGKVENKRLVARTVGH